MQCQLSKRKLIRFILYPFVQYYYIDISCNSRLTNLDVCLNWMAMVQQGVAVILDAI